MTYRSFALLSSLLFFPLQAFAGPDAKEVHQVLPLDPKGEMSLETFKGQVKITAWDRNEVKLDAIIQMDESAQSCGSAEDRAQWVQKTDVKVESTPTSIRIKSDYSQLEGVRTWNWDGFCMSNPQVNYEIMLPTHARLGLRDHKSTIQVSNVQGAIKLTTHKGKVNLRGVEGPLELDTHKGEVEVEFRKCAEASRISTHKGQVEVRLPKNSGFELDASFGKRGTLYSDFPGTQPVGKGVYRTSVNGGGPVLRLATFKGEFRLRQI